MQEISWLPSQGQTQAGEPAHTDAECWRGSAVVRSAISGECEMLHSSEKDSNCASECFNCQCELCGPWPKQRRV